MTNTQSILTIISTQVVAQIIATFLYDKFIKKNSDTSKGEEWTYTKVMVYIMAIATAAIVSVTIIGINSISK